MKNTSIVVLIATSLVACGGSSLTPKTSQQISVTSNPSGASVYVMGENLGATPLSVSSKQVFPTTYEPEKQRLYGLVTLKHEGCKEQAISISATRLSKGITANLECVSQTVTRETEKKTGQIETQPQEAPSVSAKERLKQLDDLKGEGLISEEEYQEIRQRVLDTL